MQFEQTPTPNLHERLVARLDEILWKRDFEFAELLSGLTAALWGLWLLLPWDTFEPSPGFSVMRVLAPEWGWGLVMTFIGISQLYALLIDERRPRLNFSLMASAAWVFIATAVGWANPTGTGVIIFSMFALSAFWAFLRIGRP